ncbi:MAG: hypothetical protein Q8O34_07965 [Rhodocyclaceae bacterium]|nr:hypothetical protein [Rhodocyclaceae bacterium]
MTDAIVLPPARREFQSPSGKFFLTLVSADNWKTFHALAELSALDGAVRRPVWQQSLPHEKGPRRVLVADSGAVVLLDEWINIPSRHALMLISPEGRTLAHYSIDELIATLDVSRKTISANARLGIWLSSVPVLSADGTAVEFRTAGRGLVLQLADGRLAVTD